MASVVEFPGREVAAQALTWPERARAIQIVDDPSYKGAADALKGIKALRAEADATFDPIIADAHKAHRTAIEQKRKVDQPLTEAEGIIKRAMVAFDDEQERLRREEQRRLEEEARRREEDERLALAAQLEREGNEVGDEAMVAEAHELIEAPIQPAPVATVQKATPKVDGIAYRSTWSARVTSLLELVRFVAANPSHLALIQANQPALNGQARSLRGALRIPGVRAVETRDVAARR